MATTRQRITPFLWFDDHAEEAVKFYVSIFENSRIGDADAISFVVNCETQDEVDHYWDRLSAGGQEVQAARGRVTR